jgi:hypothetical protein
MRAWVGVRVRIRKDTRVGGMPPRSHGTFPSAQRLFQDWVRELSDSFINTPGRIQPRNLSRAFPREGGAGWEQGFIAPTRILALRPVTGGLAWSAARASSAEKVLARKAGTVHDRAPPSTVARRNSRRVLRQSSFFVRQTGTCPPWRDGTRPTHLGSRPRRGGSNLEPGDRVGEPRRRLRHGVMINQRGAGV